MNIALLSLHPEGLRPYLVNWEQVAPSFVRRLRSEALASGDAQMQAMFDTFIELAGPIEEAGDPHESLLPVLPLEIRVHGVELSLFSLISTIGTPQDITADELRVEAFFPGNPETERFFRGSGS